MTQLSLPGLLSTAWGASRVSVILLFAVASAVEPSQGAIPGKTPAATRPSQDPTEEAKSRLAALLPDSKALGFKPLEEPAFFTPDNLYEYINGAAEAFLQYDFETLAQQPFRKGDTEVMVDIYDMGSALNAFGIYASERSPGSDFRPVGTEGYQAEYLLNFLQGRYYVKLSAFRESGSTDAILEAFAAEISGKIKERKEFPPELSLLPDAGRIAHTERYIRGAPLGLEFLSPALQAEYRSGESTFRLLLSLANDAQDAAGRQAKVRDHLRNMGPVTPLDEWYKGAFRGVSRYEGALTVFASGAFLAVLVGSTEDSSEFVSKLAAWLEERD